MKLKNLIPPLAFCVILFACNTRHSSSDIKVKRAFYEWGGSYSDKKQGDSLLNKLDVQRMYVRFFDVDVNPYSNGYPYPINSRYGTTYGVDDSMELVPTIFIVNSVFDGLTDSTVEILAHNVEKKIKNIINQIATTSNFDDDYYDWYDQNPYQDSKDMRMLFKRDSLRQIIYNNIPEIQFDCDWTASTKDNYFLFLKKIKGRFKDKQISSTIRLYGYKYPDKAGVPPVDKGMLMCYNAGDVRKIETVNSIFDKEEVLSYLDTEKPYPLPLDYVFPIFDWCAVYRNNKLIQLMETDLSYFSYSAYAFKEKKNFESGLPMYEVLEDHTFGYTDDAILLRKGDIIKVEQPDFDDVADIARKLGKMNTNPNPVISLYDFDFNTIITHEKSIQKIYSSF